MDFKPGTRIGNSLGYYVLFSNYGDPGHAIFVAYNPVIGKQSVLLCFLNNLLVLEKISHIYEYLLISCILMRYSLSNNLLYMLNCTFSYNKIICIFVLIASLYLFRNLLSYHRALSFPTSSYHREFTILL